MCQCRKLQNMGNKYPCCEECFDGLHMYSLLESVDPRLASSAYFRIYETWIGIRKCQNIKQLHNDT